MHSIFYCKTCQLKFTAEGSKIEFTNPIYGPCAKYIAHCPQCKVECSEYTAPKAQKSNEQTIPSCKTGGGCNCCGNF